VKLLFQSLDWSGWRDDVISRASEGVESRIIRSSDHHLKSGVYAIEHAEHFAAVVSAARPSSPGQLAR
jgi:hypothetical protein